jgi:hypothetical protein
MMCVCVCVHGERKGGRDDHLVWVLGLGWVVWCWMYEGLRGWGG